MKLFEERKAKKNETMCKSDGNTTNTASASNSPADELDKQNVFVKIFMKLYYATPPMVVPVINLSYSFSLVSAVFLLICRTIGEYIMVNVFNWPEGHEKTIESRSAISSICHSTILCTGLILAFTSYRPYSPSAKFSISPKWWQDYVDCLLQFCTGYMLYDALFNILLLRWDIMNGDLYPKYITFDDMLFLVHHIITTWYMSSTRIIQAGHMSAMCCMLLGELSNPLHNMYMMADNAITLDCCNGPIGQQMHYVIEISFAVVYNILRVIIGPIAMIHLSYDILCTTQGKTNIPLGLRITWTCMVWIVIFGSFSWIMKCNDIILKFVHEQVLNEPSVNAAEL